jgi:hypothetical protein
MRLLLLLLLAGCSHATIDAGVGTAHVGVPSAGTTVTGGGVGVHVHSNALAAVVVAGMVAAAAADHAREPRGMPSFSSLADWFRGPAAPELAPDRPVTVQDCTRPVELTGNLKCR